MTVAGRDDARSSSDPSPEAQVLARAPTRRLTRDVIGVTAIKILILAAIYALFFWGASHRLPVDTAAHIADIPAASQTR